MARSQTASDSEGPVRGAGLDRNLADVNWLEAHEDLNYCEYADQPGKTAKGALYLESIDAVLPAWNPDVVARVRETILTHHDELLSRAAQDLDLPLFERRQKTEEALVRLQKLFSERALLLETEQQMPSEPPE